MKIFTISALLILLMIVVIGGSGCLGKSENYEDTILKYLEAKYHEKFVVKKMFKEVNFSSTDSVRATCYSERNPKINFTVNYHLTFSDVHNKEEIIKLLKSPDFYSKKYLTSWKDDVEPYFEDDYANILYQSKFNNMLKRKLDLNQDYIIQTRFDTPNYYTNLNESRVDLNSYLGTENYDLYAYHFIFIKENGETLESKLNLINKIAGEVANSRITEQYIHAYFLRDYSPNKIQKKYYENYEFPNDYFANLKTCTSSAIVTLEKGIVTDSNQKILDMLGGPPNANQ
jgi:hypothetical protein